MSTTLAASAGALALSAVCNRCNHDAAGPTRWFTDPWDPNQLRYLTAGSGPVTSPGDAVVKDNLSALRQERGGPGRLTLGFPRKSGHG
jgi:hypothetical protein